MKTINITFAFNGSTYTVLDDKNRAIGTTTTPEQFRLELQNRLNKEGEFFARLLSDGNEFICWDEDGNAPYVGKPSTDREEMVGFLSPEQLQAFLNTHGEILAGLEVSSLKVYRPWDSAGDQFSVVASMP